MLALAERLGAARARHRATTRGSPTTARAAAAARRRPTRPRTRPTCSPGLRPASLARLRFPLAELTSREVREIAAAAGLPVAAKRREPGPLLPRRRGQALVPRPPRRPRRPPGRDRRRRRARVLGTHRGHHHFTVGQRRGLGVGAPASRSTCSPPTRRPTRSSSARASELATRRGRGPRRDPAPRRRPRRPRAAALPLAAARLPVPTAPAGEHAELELELGEPAYGVAPGQTACLMDGDLVVGHATIA